MRKILLFKTGQTDGSLRGDVGDYQDWFGRVFGAAVQLEVHDAINLPRADPRGLDGIIITGSPRSLVRPEAWMDDAADTVRDAAQAGVPTLGVCFGHQLIAYAHGALDPRTMGSVPNVGLDLGFLAGGEFFDFCDKVTEAVAEIDAEFLEGCGVLGDEILEEYFDGMAENDRVADLHHRSLEVEREQ